jgi:hypothetical protein
MANLGSVRADGGRIDVSSGADDNRSGSGSPTEGGAESGSGAAGASAKAGSAPGLPQGTVAPVEVGRQSLGEGSWAPGSIPALLSKSTSPLWETTPAPTTPPQAHAQMPDQPLPDPGANSGTQPQGGGQTLAQGPGVGGFYGKGFSPFGRGNW